MNNIMKKVFLGGTCNNSTWRDVLTPMLNIEVFNPVVKNWTQECMDEEIYQRQNCSILLYVITPKMTGTYSIAEAVDDSNKNPHKTIFVVLDKDSGDKFTDPQLKSLNEVAKMIVRNGGSSFNNLQNVAHYINNFL